MKIRLYGDSMEPLLKNGDYVNFKLVNFHDVKIGDIVMFNRKGLEGFLGFRFCHRIISIDRINGTFTTKGDNRKESFGSETNVPLSHIKYILVESKR